MPASGRGGPIRWLGSSSCSTGSARRELSSPDPTRRSAATRGQDLVLMVAVLIAVVVALAVARPDGATVTDALKVLPDTVRLVRRLAADPDLPPSVRRTLWVLGL